MQKFLVILLVAVMTLGVLTACSKEIEEPIEIPTLPPETTVTTVTTEPPATEPPVTEPEPLEKYLSYYEQNNDFVGWVCIPSITDSKGVPKINYAVLQTTDNSFYIDHDFDKNYSYAGWIYADYKVPMTATSQADNITLFGHSMKDGSFFRRVLDYNSYSKSGVDFLKKNSIVQFDTRYEESDYIIVACFLIGIYENQDNLPLFQYFTYRNLDTQAKFDKFYENIMLRSYFTSDIECEWGDQFVTLSTCAYNFSDSRFVIVARKAREGEDLSSYIDTYRLNPDCHMPSILYS